MNCFDEYGRKLAVCLLVIIIILIQKYGILSLLRYFISCTSIDATALAFDEQNYWKTGRSMSLYASDTTQSKQSLIYSANIEVFITLIKCTQTIIHEKRAYVIHAHLFFWSFFLLFFSPFLGFWTTPHKCVYCHHLYCTHACMHALYCIRI